MNVRYGLSLFVAVGLLGTAPGCIIINDDDGSETGNDTGPATSGSATSGSATSGSATSGGESQGDGSTAATTSASDETSSDETAAGGACGWGPTGDPTVPEGYVCGGEGEDPSGSYPQLCPDGVTLEVGGACSGIEGTGCCDAMGNAWYCGDDGNGPALAVIEC